MAKPNGWTPDWVSRSAALKATAMTNEQRWTRMHLFALHSASTVWPCVRRLFVDVVVVARVHACVRASFHVLFRICVCWVCLCSSMSMCVHFGRFRACHVCLSNSDFSTVTLFRCDLLFYFFRSPSFASLPPFRMRLAAALLLLLVTIQNYIYQHNFWCKLNGFVLRCVWCGCLLAYLCIVCILHLCSPRIQPTHTTHKHTRTSFYDRHTTVSIHKTSQWLPWCNCYINARADKLCTKHDRKTCSY